MNWKVDNTSEISSKLDTNAHILEWKRRHVLDKRFPHINVAKQIITMNQAPECKSSMMANDLMGKYQRCEDLDEEYKLCDQDVKTLWGELIGQAADVTPLMETPVMIEHTQHVDKSKMTPREAIRMFIQKKFKEIDPIFISTALELN